MDQFSYPVQCAAAQVLASASGVKRIQAISKRQENDVTAVTASFAARGSPVPAVGQVCTTDSAGRVISFFLEILTKSLALS